MSGRIYETAIRISAHLASTFRSVTGGASGALERLGLEAAKLQAADKGTESFSRLSSVATDSRRRFNVAADALDRLKASQKASGDASKEMASWIAAGAREVSRAEKALHKADQAARQAAVGLQLAGVDSSKLAKEQERLQREIAQTERRMRGLADLQSAHKRLFGNQGLSERIFGDPKEGLADRFGRQAKGAAADAVKLGAVGIGAGVGLFEIMKRVADAGDSIDDASKRLKIGGEALQALRFQGKLAGAEMDLVDASIGKLAINIGKVLAAKKKGGGGGLGPIEGLTVFSGSGGDNAGKDDPFKHLGLSAKALAKLSPEDQIERVSDSISKLKTQSERAAAATAIFGKGSLKLLPVLADGAAGIRKFREEGVRSGQFMSNDAVQASSDFNDALDGLRSRGVNLLANAMSGDLLPTVTEVMKGIGAWLTDNQDKIKAWAKSTAHWIKESAIPAVKDAGRWFLDTGVKIAHAVERLADLVGGFGNLTVAAAGVRLLPVAVSVGQLGALAWRAGSALKAMGVFTKAITAAQWLWNVAMTANPIAIIIVAAAALGVGIYLLVKHFDQVKLAAYEAWAATKGFFGGDTSELDAKISLIKQQIEAAKKAEEAKKAAEGGSPASSLPPGGSLPEPAGADSAGASPRITRALAASGGGSRIDIAVSINVPPGTPNADDIKRAVEQATPMLVERVKQALQESDSERQRVAYG